MKMTWTLWQKMGLHIQSFFLPYRVQVIFIIRISYVSSCLSTIYNYRPYITAADTMFAQYLPAVPCRTQCNLLAALHSGATPLLRACSRKIFFVIKYLITSLVFKLQKWFLHQNGVKFNKKSKSDLTKLWPQVGR